MPVGAKIIFAAVSNPGFVIRFQKRLITMLAKSIPMASQSISMLKAC